MNVARKILGLVFCMALTPTLALATNGDNLIGVGSISRAMGGVGIASPQDAVSAVFSNPAAMCFGGYCPSNETDFMGTVFSPHVKADITAGGNSYSAHADEKSYTMVHASDTTGLLVVNQLAPITVVFTLPEDQLPKVMEKLRAGEKLRVDAYDREQSKKLAQGELASLDNQIDTSTGTVKLKASFANAQNELYPNQFVNAKLLLEVLKDAIVVPTAAVQRGQQGTYLYVITPQGTASARPVSVGESGDGSVSVILKGLALGEKVVVDGAERLRDGSPVEIKTPRRSQEAANATATAPDEGAAQHNATVQGNVTAQHNATQSVPQRAQAAPADKSAKASGPDKSDKASEPGKQAQPAKQDNTAQPDKSKKTGPDRTLVYKPEGDAPTPVFPAGAQPQQAKPESAPQARP